MRFLVDEQLSVVVARSLSTFGVAEFSHIYDLGAGGTLDPDIPPLCRRNKIEGLLTLNVRDFGARLFYYEALLAAGIHVVVERWKKPTQPDIGNQVALFAMNYKSILHKLDESNGATLLVVTLSGVRQRDLADLVAEIQAGTS